VSGVTKAAALGPDTSKNTWWVPGIVPITVNVAEVHATHISNQKSQFGVIHHWMRKARVRTWESDCERERERHRQRERSYRHWKWHSEEWMWGHCHMEWQSLHRSARDSQWAWTWSWHQQRDLRDHPISIMSLTLKIDH
jgi:hypothetical protein